MEKRLNGDESTNSTIDIAKFVMAILVVGIHTEPFGFNVWLDRGFGIITRLCVPFFFVASSYFYWSRKPTKPIKDYLLRLLLLYFIWIMIYLPLDFGNIKNWSLLPCLKMFLWSGYRHMWYINCSIIGFLIVCVLSKWVNSKILFIISFVFLLYGCCKSTWLPLIDRLTGITIHDYLGSRNGLFYAFPYMAIGKHIAETKKSTNTIFLYIKFMISCVLLMLESYIFAIRYHTAVTILWLAVFPISYYLFQILLSIKIVLKKSLSIKFRSLSTLVYFIHPLFIALFDSLLKYFPLFLVVSIVSIVISYVIITLSNTRILKVLKYSF